LKIVALFQPFFSTGCRNNFGGTKIMGKKARLLFSIAVIVTLFSCTKTPFGDEDISAGAGQVSGVVQLYDGSSAENVYVWLEGFAIGSYTDSNGFFTLTLPPKSSHGTSSGVSGTFKLYFYLANYLLKSAQVVVQENEFVYSKGDINKDGKIYEPIVLRRFLRIQTEVSPASVKANNTNPIAVEVTLTATIDSATVVIPKSVGGMLGAVLIKKIDTSEVQIYQSAAGAITQEVILVGLVSKKVGMGFDLMQKPLATGKYKVIPYLFIAHEKLPAGLMDSLLPEVETLNSNYLKLPFNREGGDFEVR